MLHMNEQDMIRIYGTGDKVRVLASGRAIVNGLMKRGARTTLYASANPDNGKIEEAYWSDIPASPHDVAIADGQCFIDRYYEAEACPLKPDEGATYHLYLPQSLEEAAACYQVRVERREAILAKLYAEDTEGETK